MAHSTIHFAFGMVLGSYGPVRALLRSRTAGQPLAAGFRRWLLLSYALGAVAVIPNLLRRAGVPGAVCEGWWMNVFLLHHLLDIPPFTGRRVGEFLIAALFLLQYTALLGAIRYARRFSRP